MERLDPIWTTARNSRRKRNPESINRVISKVERDQDRLVTRRSHERGAGGIARRRNVQSSTTQCGVCVSEVNQPAIVIEQ